MKCMNGRRIGGTLGMSMLPGDDVAVIATMSEQSREDGKSPAMGSGVGGDFYM